MTDELYVDVTRGDYVESVHRVAACAVDARGNVLEAAGDVESPVFLRSAAKPFIAAAAIEAGVHQRFGLEAREIAVMAASHTGEPFHVDAVRSILRKIGLDSSALQCGVHPPYDEATAKALIAAGEEPTVLHNNCSGKHAGILALALAIGADTSTYLSADNPAQRRILALCARVSDDDPDAWPVATDGCGIPVYATALRKAAISFARLATLDGIADGDAKALRMVRDAMLAHPEYVAGTSQFDTDLMIAGQGNLVSKSGAEGVAAVGAIAQGYGFAAKALDGATRARGPSTIAALTRLGMLDAEKSAQLVRFAHPPVYNRAGKRVGEIVSRDRV
ncbi:MAG TPA: asparaginase [Candidatus Cybelea sp.]|nr:asparaginase [Candidatus Cybelea sp.]